MKTPINLIPKYQKDKRFYISKIKEFKTYTERHPNFKIGDVIQFYGGYNNDILYQTEILGFDVDNEIYVLWDCYWFPIQDDIRRNINLITQ